MKKSIGITLFLALVAGMSVDCIAQGKLTVVVTGVRNASGTIRVGLFDTSDQFLKNAKVGETAKAAAGQVAITFTDLPKGEYAISVIHDENGNEELDSNFIGIPQEGFGFGNNKMGMFGPPSFDEAKIKWEGTDLMTEIKLKYL